MFVMPKQYGQFLKKSPNEEMAQTRLSWLDMPHDYKVMMAQPVPDPSLATAAFLLPFHKGQLLMVQGRNESWNFVGGHVERGESLEEAISREVFEETGTSPAYMAYLGYIELNLHGEVPPAGWRYPFPTSYLSFYWGAFAGDETGALPCQAEGKSVQFVAPDKALKRPSVQDIEVIYKEALERASLFEEAMQQASA